MTRAGSDNGKAGPERKRAYPFFQLGIEIVDVFLPFMDSNCLAVYSYLNRKEYSNPTLAHSAESVASAIGLSKSTVSRSLEILQYLKLVRLIRFTGNRDSECKLLDSAEAALQLGAIYSALSFSLPTNEATRVKSEIEAIRQRQQGKLPNPVPNSVLNACGNRLQRVPQRNAGVSPERRELPTRETQTGFHLLQKEERTGRIPTPTPSQDGKLWKTKKPANEDGPVLDSLRWARVKFNGVMKDMRDHLLNGSKPPMPRITDGYSDWEAFGFESFCVERVEPRGKAWGLVLSASDPAAARRGVEKYHRTWDESVRRWFEGEVLVELVEASRKA